jgi:ribosomal protein S18 acetylase RimI-like enzyme
LRDASTFAALLLEARAGSIYQGASTMRVRIYLAAEAQALLDLWAAAAATPSPTDTLVDLARVTAHAHARCLVAEVDGGIVGSIIATFDGWRGHLYRLAVHPAHRRKGIARALVAAAEEVLAGWGVRRVSALVEKDHPWAVEFWKAVGYDDDLRIARFVRNVGPREG